MSERKTRIKLSDGTTWPRPELENDEIAGVGWKLRYNPQSMTRADHLYAASIISAYGYMMAETTRARRDQVCRDIRAELRAEVSVVVL